MINIIHHQERWTNKIRQWRKITQRHKTLQLTTIFI